MSWRTRGAFVFVFVLAIIFVFLFVALPIIAASNPPRTGSGAAAIMHCVYGDISCSTMVAAWFLALATLAAFIAAAVAARYAWRTFSLETKVQLGQNQCLKHDNLRADIVRYLPENGQLTKAQPDGFEPVKYHIHEHAFTALCRASVVGAAVSIKFRMHDNKEFYPDSITLGHIQPQAETHVRIYTHFSLGNPFVVWHNARYDGGPFPNGIAFFPGEESNGRLVKVVNIHSGEQPDRINPSL